MVLVDTDVLVECLRGSIAARNWLEAYPKETFAIPGAVAMELVSGCRNQADLQQVRAFLGSFNIAATALARVYTFNLKHFQAVVGLDAQQPYPRERA